MNLDWDKTLKKTPSDSNKLSLGNPRSIRKAGWVDNLMRSSADRLELSTKKDAAWSYPSGKSLPSDFWGWKNIRWPITGQQHKFKLDLMAEEVAKPSIAPNADIELADTPMITANEPACALRLIRAIAPVADPA